MIEAFEELGVKYKIVDSHRRYYYNCRIVLNIDISEAVDTCNNPISIPYLWCMSVSVGAYNEKFTGRDLTELKNTLNNIYADARLACDIKADDDLLLPIYVYDLQYLNYFLEPVFGVVTDYYKVKGEYSIVEYSKKFRFRSMKVFNKDTRDFIKNNNYFDNTKVRTPFTELDEEEFVNCVCVVDGLDTYLENFMNISDAYDYFSLPVSISRTIKDRMYYWCYKMPYFKYGELVPFVKKDLINIQDVRENDIIENSISGGICAFNENYACKITEKVMCFDYTSGYPGIMFSSNRFPVEFLSYYDELKLSDYRKASKKYAIISNLWFKNLRLKGGFPKYLNVKNVLNLSEIKDDLKTDEDGYIISCKGLIQFSGCEMDYFTIKNFYNFDGFHATNCYVYKTGYLPDRLVGCMLQYFKDKCKYKGVNGMLHLYLMSKRCTNMCFGINYTSPCSRYGETFNERLNIVVGEDDKDEYDIKSEMIAKYNNSESRCTCYQWGMYIAAIMRARLSTIISKAVELGIWIYSDTDSVFVKYNEEFIKYIQKLNENNYKNMEKVGRLRDNNNWRVNGQILGSLTVDHICPLFKVLGRKTYMYFDKDDKKIITKTAGIPSEDVDLMFKYYDCKTILDKFNMFKKETIINSMKAYSKFGKLSTNVTDHFGDTYLVTVLGGVNTKEICQNKLGLSFEMRGLISFLMELEESDYE